MLSRQDYVVVAAGIREHVTLTTRAQRGETLRVMLATISGVAHALCRQFEDDNARFDRTRFLDACGLHAQCTCVFDDTRRHVCPEHGRLRAMRDTTSREPSRDTSHVITSHDVCATCGRGWGAGGAS